VIGPGDLSIVGAAVPGESGQLSQMQAPTIALATQVKPADERAAAEDMAGDGTINENDLDDEEDGENWLSVAAIEAELKPKRIEAGTHKRLRRLQDRGVQFEPRRMPLSLAQERNYGRLKTK
jgi:RNA polymerase primary sigma factor